MTLNRIDDALVQHWLIPDWSAPDRVPAHVRGYVTTRAGHLSAHPYDGFNTANHVGDDPGHVEANRQSLAEYFDWTREPQWLKQVHGIEVIEARGDGVEREGDAVFTREPGQVCTLHTADCLPVFFTSKPGDVVGLAHAGWRGLADGVLESTVEKMGVAPDQLEVWFGPAIGQEAFEVGDDVRNAFLAIDATAERCFHLNMRDRWQCDLYGLARQRLQSVGVQAISGGNYCTFSDPRFFSYRRQSVTGRMLAMIWIEPD